MSEPRIHAGASRLLVVCQEVGHFLLATGPCSCLDPRSFCQRKHYVSFVVFSLQFSCLLLSFGCRTFFLFLSCVVMVCACAHMCARTQEFTTVLTLFEVGSLLFQAGWPVFLSFSQLTVGVLGLQAGTTPALLGSGDPNSGPTPRVILIVHT